MKCIACLKMVVCFLFVTTNLQAADPPADASPDRPLKVMTYNIRYANPSDGENAWPHRKDWVARLVNQQQPDVVAMQEVLALQLSDLQDRLPDFDYYGVGRDDGKERGEFVPIFYRKDRLEILDKGTFWLSETPDRPGSKSWDAAITRICTWVQFKERNRMGDEQAARSFFVLNNHFDHQGNVARQESARLLVKRMQETFAQQPVFVLGDLNTLPNSVPIQVLTGKGSGRPLSDGYRVSQTPPTGPDSTWNGFNRIVPGQRIDYILVSPGIVVENMQVIDEQREGRFPSDHLPVTAQLSWNLPEKK